MPGWVKQVFYAALGVGLWNMFLGNIFSGLGLGGGGVVSNGNGNGNGGNGEL